MSNSFDSCLILGVYLLFRTIEDWHCLFQCGFMDKTVFFLSKIHSVHTVLDSSQRDKTPTILSSRQTKHFSIKKKVKHTFWSSATHCGLRKYGAREGGRISAIFPNEFLDATVIVLNDDAAVSARSASRTSSIEWLDVFDDDRATSYATNRRFAVAAITERDETRRSAGAESVPEDKKTNASAEIYRPRSAPTGNPRDSSRSGGVSRRSWLRGIYTDASYCVSINGLGSATRG